MRKLVWGLALLVSAAASPALAQDADTLRRELEQMRKQFESLQKEQQKALEAMAERLRKLEAEGAARTATPIPGAVVQTATPSGAPVTPAQAPSTTDLLRPREPFKLSAQRGPGQLLFDMGIAADFVGTITQR
ncbi:MAG TPA: hypothetical protein VEA38_22920, partial [Terriglobales bacterium]|nr:hypothetical protein [Terriglobales bacterium]